MKSKSTQTTTIDAYIASFPAEIQAILQQVRATVKRAAPQAEEAIKYQLPTLVLHGNLVHFGAFKNHLGFYPTPRGIESFAKELANYVCTKGAIQFPYEKPIPYGLIGKITKHRVKESLEKLQAKTKKTAVAKSPPAATAKKTKTAKAKRKT